MKILYILFAAIAMLFSSCSNDEIAANSPEESNTAPQLNATVEQESVTTKSGVIEDNDYTLGEKFYWTNGDATTVFFVNGSMTHQTQYKKVEYSANVAAGVKSNSCTFDVTEAENIDDGEYTVYGLFPTAAWETRTNYIDFMTVNIPAYQMQTQANSTHLGTYMPMKAKNTVMVGSNSINLNYKHLASVVRFAVWNNSGDNNLKLANINVKLNSGKAVFATQAKLADIDAALLTVDNLSNVPGLTLQLTGDAQNFSTKDGKNQCEGYMAVLPTATDAFESSDDLIIELSFTDGTNNYLVTKIYNIGTSLNFLSNGMEQGKSYYFQLEVGSGDISAITGTSYVVGDYWPDSTNPEGIVFWLKPGRFGTRGKVVGLGETYISKWGLENDEQAAGVTGIRSLTDGAAATRNLILKYRESPTFNIDYPAFFHIYTLVNGGNENGVWYLPALNELNALYAGYNGRVYESIMNWVGYMPGYDSAECINARQAFNTKLTTKNGDAFSSNGDWYLSSSEISDKRNYSFTFANGSGSADDKTYDGNIRWIREF